MVDCFCINPWVQIRTETLGEFRPCCNLKPELSEYKGKREYNFAHNSYQEYFTSDYLTYIRDNLQQGKQIKECDSCWQKERAGFESMRQEDNRAFLKGNNSIKDLIIKQGGKVLSADIKLGNLCNFACGMCRPEHSTTLYKSWIKEQDNEFVQGTDFETVRKIFTKDDPEIIEQLLTETNLLHLKLLGGEPFMYSKILERLRNQPSDVKARMKLTFVTNASHDVTEIVKSLGNYKNIFISASLEGAGTVQDYIRKGSKWKNIRDNVLKFRDYCSTNSQQCHLSVVTVLQNLNAHHLLTFKRWLELEQIKFTFYPIEHPDYLTHHTLSNEYLESFLTQDILTLQGPSNEDDELLHRFIRWLDWYERDHTLKLRNVAPELYEYVAAAR